MDVKLLRILQRGFSIQHCDPCWRTSEEQYLLLKAATFNASILYQYAGFESGRIKIVISMPVVCLSSFSQLSLELLCFTVSCVEEVLKADSGQLHAEDSAYGGTPLHWAKTAEVSNIPLYFLSPCLEGKSF